MLGCLDKRRISVSIFAIFFGGTNWIWIVLSQVPFSLSLFTLGAIFGAALSIWNFAFVLGNCSIFLPEVPSIQAHPRTHVRGNSCAQLPVQLLTSVCVCVLRSASMGIWHCPSVNRSTGQPVKLFEAFFHAFSPQLFRFAVQILCKISQATDALGN